MRRLSVDLNRISESVGHRRITVRVRFPRIAFLFACTVILLWPTDSEILFGSTERGLTWYHSFLN